MEALKTIIGIRETKSKKTGNSFYNYYMTEPFTDYEKDNSVVCAGEKVCEEGSYVRFDVQIGDQVKCYYEKGYQGTATLSEIIVKVPAPVKNKQ